MKTVSVNSSVQYDIVIEKGSLSKVGAYASSVFPHGAKAAVITDDTVASFYLETVQSALKAAGFSVVSFVFPHGEESKSAATLSDVYEFLVEEQVTRSDFIVALGGGVVGDLAGYAAATYLRGIRFMQIPTTFLAAVDSSVGGKTAINIPAGKNLVGAFWQPSLVVCDTNTFETLPAVTFADGISETIKYGMIASRSLFERMEQGCIGDEIDEIIAECVSIKRDVVEQDERDNGLRMILNYGHTLGHAIEKATHHSVTHGQGVALGMVLIAKLGEKLGYHSSDLTQRLERCIAAHGLPTHYDGSISKLADAVLRDKKRAGDTIRLIFVKNPGQADIVPLPVEQFLQLLSEV